MSIHLNKGIAYFHDNSRHGTDHYWAIFMKDCNLYSDTVIIRAPWIIIILYKDSIVIESRIMYNNETNRIDYEYTFKEERSVLP